MKLSAILYAIVIVAFFMPFFVVSCEKTELVTLKGIQLVTGGEAEVEMAEMLSALGNKNKDNNQTQKIKAQPLAIAVFAFAIITFVFVLIFPRKLYYIPALLSLAGVFMLQILRSSMVGVLSKADTGMNIGMDISKMLTLHAKSGFWLANAALVLGGVTCLIYGVLGLAKEKNSIPLAANPEIFDHLSSIPPRPLHNSADPVEEPFRAISEADEMLAEEEETKDPEV